MKPVANFIIKVSEVGDHYLAEIDHVGTSESSVVLSGSVRPHIQLSEETVRHFALKSFVLKIADALRERLANLN